MALFYAQLGGVRSLRGIETAVEAHAHHHYHLGVSPFARSTLSDANARRPVALSSVKPDHGRTVRSEPLRRNKDFGLI